MQANNDELRAFGERRQYEQEADAAAIVGNVYASAAHAFEVLGAYLGRLRGADRARVIEAVCRKVEATIEAERYFLAACRSQQIAPKRKGFRAWLSQAFTCNKGA